MKKILKKHSNKIFIAACSIGLCITCDWQWTNIKSFITGAVIVWMIYRERD